MTTGDKKEGLIKDLVQEGYLRTRPVIEAFRLTKRERFVLPGDRQSSYSDNPLNIGLGQTISAPHMVAIMTENLEPRKTDKVLEVGGGSGYQAAILSHLVKRVVSVELEKGLVSLAERNLKAAGIKNVRMVQGDGSSGFQEEAPYDKIIVSCGSDKAYPEWEKQLKPGGFILVPLNNQGYQTLYRIKKGSNRWEKLVDCFFVPLRH